jgi:hypothetical protein
MAGRNKRASIYSTEKDVTQRYCILWEIIRRHSGYKDFCLKYRDYFDRDRISFLDETRLSSIERLECERIKDRFRLKHIVCPKSSIPEKTMKAFPFFRDEHSVDPEIMEREDGSRTPIWEDRFVRLRIDIRGFRTDKEIKKEFWDCIKWARGINKIERAIQRLPDEETLMVWDLKKKGWKDKEIIRKVWPQEYKKEFGSLTDFQRDELFKELDKKYYKEEFKNAPERASERAYNEAYGESGSGKKSGRIRLFMRVVDKVNRLEEVFKEFFPP